MRIAQYGQYVLVWQDTGMQIALYQAVPVTWPSIRWYEVYN